MHKSDISVIAGPVCGPRSLVVLLVREWSVLEESQRLELDPDHWSAGEDLDELRGPHEVDHDAILPLAADALRTLGGELDLRVPPTGHLVSKLVHSIAVITCRHSALRCL